jgi:hypothetical protein
MDSVHITCHAQAFGLEENGEMGREQSIFPWMDRFRTDFQPVAFARIAPVDRTDGKSCNNDLNLNVL